LPLRCLSAAPARNRYRLWGKVCTVRLMSKLPRMPRSPQGLPDDDTLLEVLKTSRDVDVSALARHFGLKGEERRLLRHRLKALAEKGKIDKHGRKTFSAVGAL